MTLPKFIITIDGVFRLGQVNQHKHLLKQGDQCLGGNKKRAGKIPPHERSIELNLRPSSLPHAA